MRERYSLGQLGNEELLAALSGLVRRGNELTADLLAHLGEAYERRLHLELGFPSLFAYCTQKLGLSESAAGRRIAAAYLCRKFPEAFAHVARGELHLSALCAMNPHLSPENAADLFEVCSHQSARRVEELLASRFPRPDVQESIRLVPSRPGVSRLCAATEAVEESAKAKGPLGAPAITCRALNSDEPAVPLLVVPPARSRQSQRALEPLSEGRFLVRFTADAEFRDLLEQARALASHRQPEGDLVSLMKLGLKAYLRELEKARFGVGKKPRGAARAATTAAAQPTEVETTISLPTVGCEDEACAVRDASPSTRSRHVPAAVAREVYLRDQGRCTFVSRDGKRCAARHFIEIDHIDPWALGGEPSVENLRLCCRAHNQQYARRYFGQAYVQAARSLRGEKKA